MAACDMPTLTNTGYLNMLDCMFKGLNHPPDVFRRALADAAERGLTCELRTFPSRVRPRHHARAWMNMKGLTR